MDSLIEAGVASALVALLSSSPCLEADVLAHAVGAAKSLAQHCQRARHALIDAGMHAALMALTSARVMRGKSTDYAKATKFMVAEVLEVLADSPAMMMQSIHAQSLVDRFARTNRIRKTALLVPSSFSTPDLASAPVLPSFSLLPCPLCFCSPAPSHFINGPFTSFFSPSPSSPRPTCPSFFTDSLPSYSSQLAYVSTWPAPSHFLGDP